MRGILLAATGDPVISADDAEVVGRSSFEEVPAVRILYSLLIRPTHIYSWECRTFNWEGSHTWAYDLHMLHQ
jgi:hypothetical protein